MSRRLGAILCIASAIFAWIFWVLSCRTPAAAANIGSPEISALVRGFEPVIVRGIALDAFDGLPVDEFFVYRYGADGWRQVPAQVDEVTAAGVYVGAEDGLLDWNDEIVFMAADTGDQPPADQPVNRSVPQAIAWYEIAVTDPVNPGQRGWAYLVHAKGLAATVTADYVSFDPGRHRLSSKAYVLGIGAAHPGPDHLTLGESTVDLLDRTKVTIYCTLPIVCPINESRFLPIPDDLAKDGPVRVVLRNGRIMAYEALVRWSADYETQGRSVRFSIDFTPAALGATLFGAPMSEGIIVDGINEDIPATPASSWWQLRTPYGSLIQVTNIADLGGTITNYHLDSAVYEGADSGDHVHFGDTGILVHDPRPSLTYTFNLYFLPAAAPNSGTLYDAYFRRPLAVTAIYQGGEPRAKRVYLPLAAHNMTSANDYDDFYTPPVLGQLTPNRLGEILRFEHMGTYTADQVSSAAGVPASPFAAEAYRILYLSQEPVGTPRAVSGVIIVPVDAGGAESFPVLVHGHQGPDLADTCAPSKDRTSPLRLLPWVTQGYLVVAPDYVGLGTPGLHPSLVGEAEARSMLDAARAALRFRDSQRGMTKPPAANRIILEGPSLGGHAALFAHQLWPAYAPALDIRGTVTFAPISELDAAARLAAFPPAPTIGPVVLGLYAYSQYYGAPGAVVSWLKQPYADQLPTRADSQCAASFITWLGASPDAVFQPAWLSAVREQRWDDWQPWQNYVEANTPGNFSSTVPVLILQGLNDNLNPLSSAQALAQRLCARGTSAQLNTYVGASHFSIVAIARTDALRWMADRLDGLPAPAGCTGP